MPTNEERISTLEFNLDQFKTETMHSYSDMAYRITMLQGLTEDAIKRLAAFRNEMNEFRADTKNRFDLVDDRLNQMYDELNAHTLLLHQILDKLNEGK